MVDNENQWEDMEYTGNASADNYDVPDVDEDDYIDQEYDDQGDYEEEYEEYEGYENGGTSQKKGNSSTILLLLLILFVCIGVFVYKNRTSGGEETVKQPVQQATMQQPSDSTEMGDYFFNEANGESSDMMSVNFDDKGNTNVVTQTDKGEEVATVTETPSANADVNVNGEEENAIMVSYSRPVRMNPFKPTDEAKKGSGIPNDTGFEIIEPPVASVPDENLTKLLQTQISGILYDEESPSAIVNLNGLDQFVKIGDNVGGYIIEGITRNQVQITYKNNTYVASVGELFTRGTLESSQAVVNLENKFAGRNRNK